VNSIARVAFWQPSNDTLTGFGATVGAWNAHHTAEPSTPSGCYRPSNKGHCYEPGEYCRDSDHGASGVAGDGERIICEDNDGWRWEPLEWITRGVAGPGPQSPSPGPLATAHK